MFLTNLLICLLGTFLSAMSGCGTGILIIPIWIMMGYSLPLGLSVLQVTSVLWCPVAARNYLKGEKLDYKLLLALFLSGMLGTFVGANTITQLDTLVAGRFVGIVVVLVSILINFIDQNHFAKNSVRHGNILASVLAFPLGLYEAAFGSGNAILTSFVLIKTKGITLSQSLGYYYIVATFWCLSSASIYFLNGFYDWSLLIAATIGSVLGAELGSKFGRARGSLFLKKSILLAGLILGIKMIIASF